MKMYIRTSESIDDSTYELDQMQQEYTSEKTSINFAKVPAVFKLVTNWRKGTINIDYGGGRADTAADYLTQYDVINLVYDPYNRTAEHNKEVIKTLRRAGGADTATCSNVLNVIKEPEVRKNVLENISKIVKPGGKVYITVYEGSGKGDEGPTKAGYQLNRKTADYLDEIREVFPDANRKGKLIVATNSRTINSSTHVESDEICRAISGDKSAIQSLKKQGYKINRLANPLQFSEVGTYEIIDPTTGKTYNYDNTLSYYANKKVNASQSYLDRIEELMEQGLDEETASREAYAEFYPDEYDVDDYDEIYSATMPSSRYWYFTRHGVQPGSVPKYVNILDIVDTPEGSYFLADGVIRTDDLRKYEIKERKPESGVVEASKSTMSSTDKYTEYMKVSRGGQDFSVHYDLIDNSPSADAHQMWLEFQAAVSPIKPYDDADYAWAQIENGHINVIKGGKVIQQYYYLDADDMDVENTDWCDAVIDLAIQYLEIANKDVTPRIIHNSTNIASEAQASITASADGYVYTHCDNCGKKNRVKVHFTDYFSPFDDIEYKCPYCNGRNLLHDPHIYDESGQVVNTSEDIYSEPDEVIYFKNAVNSADTIDDIQFLIYELSDGVAEEACQEAFDTAVNSDIDDIDTVKQEVISAIDMYLEDNEFIEASQKLDASTDKKLTKLKDKILSAVKDVMMSPNFGFLEDEVNEYSFVDVYPEGRVEVRAEVDYDGLMELVSALNPIIQKYDKDSYFEPVEPGIIEAYLNI